MLQRSKAFTAWYEKYFIVILLLGVGGAMVVSLLIGLMQSVWFDEAYSILLAEQPLNQLVYLTSIDTHPPFYYIVLKIWGSVFGWSEVALRSLSVLAMGGAMILGLLFVKRCFGMRAALATLPFVVMAPFLLRYGFEIRMYALASLIGVAATYALIIAVDSVGRKQRLMYGVYAVLVVLGMMTLYYTVLLWIAHFVWLIWQTQQAKKPVFRQKWWLAYAGSTVLFLPWLPVFLSQLGNGALAPISQQLTTENMIGILSFWFLYQPAWQLDGLLSLLIVVVISTVVYSVISAWRVVPAQQKQYFALLLCYTLVPIITIALISLVRPMYVERYLAQAMIGLGLLVGVSIWLAVRKNAKKMRLIGLGLAAVLLAGMMQVISTGNYNFQRLQRPQIRQAVTNIMCDTKHPVFAADPYVAVELSYYMKDCNVYFYSDVSALRGGYAPLSSSTLRISDPGEAFKEYEQVTYVYYDTSQAPLPTDKYLIKDMNFGALHVQVFSAE